MSLPTTYNLLSKYPNQVYCETGIFRGDSLLLAAETGHFKQLIGVELFDEWIKFCKSRFHKMDYPIRYVHGDSALCLWDVIKHIHTPITFFLDSHSQLLEDEPEMANPFPLIDELRQIARHPIKGHTLIIDDLLYLTHPDITGWSYAGLVDSICRINPQYKIERIANPVKWNLLIATV